MTKITIVDTGFLTADRDGTAKAGDDIDDPNNYICNSGTAIVLNCPKFSLDGGTNISADPNPSSGAATKTVFNTFKNETYTVPFIIDSTSGSETSLLKQINALHKTPGVKLLYSSDTSSTIKMLPEILGRDDTKFNSSTINGIDLTSIKVLICRVIGIHIDNLPKSINYNITGHLTIIEEKTIAA